MNTLTSYSPSPYPKFSVDSSTIHANETSPSVYPEDWLDLMKALLFIESIEDNWDGHQGIAPTQMACDCARKFIKAIPLNKLHATTISPDGDGGIVLRWKSSDLNLSITFDGSHMHPILITSQNVYPLEIIPFFDNGSLLGPNDIPKELLKNIPDRRS